MKKDIIILSTIAVALLAGCNPYQFNMGDPHEVRCQVLTSLSSVDQGYNRAMLHNTGAIDMNYFGATQYLVTMEMKLIRGDGFRIMLRPVVEQRDVRDSGIVLTVTHSGVWLDSASHIFLTRRDVKLEPNTQMPVSLLSDDNYVQIVLGCDTVYKGWSKKMESDDIVIQALPNSDVQILSPDWAGLPDR
ncbi:MAG TPA: hypothetical protein VG537_08725 [Candidatus Kapabacteria bacterium]|jgi:hypothetical protein|nr:hypothetical protein [Candidatus Kapabacteria bacterium]